MQNNNNNKPDHELHTSFSGATWQQFKSDCRPGPIHMLNLVRLRQRAEYPEGTRASGAQAYRRYSDISAPVLQRLGGSIIWRGSHELTMVGPPGPAWDIAFIARYPDVDAFVAIMRDADYREAMKHRKAAVLDSRLLRFAATDPGNSFSG